MHISGSVKINWHLLESLIFTQVKIRPCGGQITMSEIEKKFTHLQSQTRSLQYQCTYQVWWKSTDTDSSYHPEMKVGQTDIWQTDRCPIWNHGTTQLSWGKGVKNKNVNKHGLLGTIHKQIMTNGCIEINIFNDKQCRSWSVGFFRSQLIWIYTVC